MNKAIVLVLLCCLIPLFAAGQGFSGTGGRPASGNEFDTDFTISDIPFSEIISGGPGKDGIPAIDQPIFISTDTADKILGGSEPVIVVTIADTIR